MSDKPNLIRLTCAMSGCLAEVTHADNRGFIYCAPHGVGRRAYCPCRKLRPAEIKRLLRSETIKY